MAAVTDSQRLPRSPVPLQSQSIVTQSSSRRVYDLRTFFLLPFLSAPFCITVLCTILSLTGNIQVQFQGIRGSSPVLQQPYCHTAFYVVIVAIAYDVSGFGILKWHVIGTLVSPKTRYLYVAVITLLLTSTEAIARSDTAKRNGDYS